MKKFQKFLLLLLLAGSIAISGCGQQQSGKQQEAQTSQVEEEPTAKQEEVQTSQTETVTTSKGNFVVPGTAYMDGRDLQASPPLTVMNINVWEGVPRQNRVCSLQHGTKVELLEAQFYSGEQRYYFRVQSGYCEGWVPESFVSNKRHRAVGDRF